MRVDSVGIYDNRGLVPNKNLPGAAENISKPKAAGSNVPPNAGRKISTSSKPNTINLLSSDESAQIRRLFGQFDLTELSQSGRVSEIDSRPGRFVDIIV